MWGPVALKISEHRYVYFFRIRFDLLELSVQYFYAHDGVSFEASIHDRLICVVGLGLVNFQNDTE